MYRILFVILLSTWNISLSTYSYSQGFAYKKCNDPRMRHMADSIMINVYKNAQYYKDKISNYEADVYIKGHTEILKHNAFIRYLPTLIPFDYKNKETIFEGLAKVRFVSPNRYYHQFQAVNGNLVPSGKQLNEALNFLNLNANAETIYNNEIITPVTTKAFKYYDFWVDEIIETKNGKSYKICVMPKKWSQKLICGNIYIKDKKNSIEKIDINGRMSFAEFNLIMDFKDEYPYSCLPEAGQLDLRYHVPGNVIVCNYNFVSAYKSVKWLEYWKKEENKKKSLDETNYFFLESDTLPVIKDSTFWNKNRKVILSEQERKILYTPLENKETTDTTNVQKYLKLTETLTNTIKFDLSSTNMKYSGLLNPFMFGYTKLDGISFKQQLRISKRFHDDKQIRFRPLLGFVFKRKELFYNISGDWIYAPRRMGTISLTFANGNRTYSSEITEQIKELVKDSLFSFSNLNLKYYKDYYVELRNKIEISNGLQVYAGLSFHNRISVKDGKGIALDKDINKIINGRYNDFNPYVGITFSPYQHYKMDGKNKEYVQTNYPTLSLEYARGIPGVMKSIGDYERIEADIEQRIDLGNLKQLNYYAGGGLFSRQRSVYFADFRFFTHHNFPQSWNDRIGGVFQLLPGEWYNASTSYVQLHIMYESPFILMHFLKRNASKHIFSERIYYSQLYTPSLPSYTEIGYGIGNHIFNIALFAGFKRKDCLGAGFRFAFELFQ